MGVRQTACTLIVLTAALTGAAIVSAQPQVDILHTSVPSQHGCAVSRLIEGADGSLYGTTRGCGQYSQGTIFRLAADGRFMVLHQFAGGLVDGSEPDAPLLQASDGWLYGTTGYGGLHGYGIVFRIASDGTSYTVLHAFDGVDGRWSSSPLVEVADGSFYGDDVDHDLPDDPSR